MKVCIVGASGKLGKYMIDICLKKGYELVGVCREQSVPKLAKYEDKIEIVPGATNDREVIEKAVKDCDAVLTVLVPWGVHDYSSGTARAVMEYSRQDARLVFSCGWHITKDKEDIFSNCLKCQICCFGLIGKLFRLVDIDDQVRACDTIFESDKRWTVVRGSDLEEGESAGLPVWSEHVHDPIVASNLTKRIDFAMFMVEAIEMDELIHQAPAICGCDTPSAREHGGDTPEQKE